GVLGVGRGCRGVPPPRRLPQGGASARSTAKNSARAARRPAGSGRWARARPGFAAAREARYAEPEGVDVRVLIAVCEPKLARLIGRGLKEEGHSTELAADGEIALDWLADDLPFDLLILDAELARPSGLEILTALPAAQVDPPALLLTASDATGDIVSGLNRGADAILAKPFAFDELLARARALLRRRSAYRSPRLELGDLTLDPAAHRVTRSGRRITLSARE